MKKLLLLAIASLPSFSEAALPPLYQSLREYQALIEHPHLKEKLPSSQPILEIAREENSFTLSTPNYTLSVAIRYLPQAQPGPAQFELLFRDLEPKGE